MQKVTGIGGIFFRAREPGPLAPWYEDHLGVGKAPEPYEEGSWWQEERPTVFAPFESDTDSFDDAKTVDGSERLGMDTVVFPGDHGGFLGGECGQMGEPDAFAAKLREVLA